MKLRATRIGLTLAGNALGLWIAALVVGDDMRVSGIAFLVAVAIFSALTLIIEPLIVKFTEGSGAVLAGGSALISTAAALMLTALISDGLTIDGIGTWIIATVLVWLITAILGVVLTRAVIKDAPKP